MSDILIDIGLYLSYILCAGAALAAVVFPALFLIKNPQKAKTTLMGTGILALLFGLCYVLSSGDVLPAFADFGITASGSKTLGAGLIMLYLLGIISVLIAVYSEIKALLK